MARDDKGKSGKGECCIKESLGVDMVSECFNDWMSRMSGLVRFSKRARDNCARQLMARIDQLLCVAA